jgi:3-hydroxybutyryl-CoA dehydrogenase
MSERLGVVGSGTIACGLAAIGTRIGDVVLVARSDESAARAEDEVARTRKRLKDADGDGAVRVSTDIGALADRTFVVEAIVEHHGTKGKLLAQLDDVLGEDAVSATTTSSLSVTALGRASGRPDRFLGFHVFNPVAKMRLVELAFADDASERTRQRARDLCAALDKTAVEVPDTKGFVVNRLLFPYLFDAVRLLEETGLSPEDVDTCMTLGSGMPMGPLALLDLIGIDVAIAIGEELELEIPERLRQMEREGALGRKADGGFHTE